MSSDDTKLEHVNYQVWKLGSRVLIQFEGEIKDDGRGVFRTPAYELTGLDELQAMAEAATKAVEFERQRLRKKLES
jgi:hypothetical protein